MQRLCTAHPRAVSAPAPVVAGLCRATRVMMCVLMCAAMCLAIAGCGGDEAPPASDTAAAADTAAATDVASADTGQGDDGQGGDSQADGAAACPGGPGCACAVADDCDSGLCIDTSEGKRCTATCVEDCPAGQLCRQLASGRDADLVCVPRRGFLCRPCTADADCAAPGLPGARCVDHGDEGGFCGVACDDDTPCPEGAACVEGLTLAGAKTRQCRPGTAEEPELCGCSPAASSALASTGCAVPDPKAGPTTTRRCQGSRSCGKDGLSPCALPKAPVCVDTACEGKADGTPCDDADPCTGIDTGDTCVGGACQPGQDACTCRVDTDCLAKEDGDLCNGTLFCDHSALPWSCKLNPATVVTCTGKGSACAPIACDPATGACGAANAPTGTPCDDSDPCTQGDTCAGGLCKSGADLCACKADSDCAGSEDGDLCNGTLYCDKSAQPWSCKVNPSTVVACPTGKNTACQKSVCAPKSGACALTPINGGGSCDDGYACTSNDFCKSGACVPGTLACQCGSDTDCAKFEDGDLCNGTLYCDKAGGGGTCKLNPSTVVSCTSADDTACLKNQCHPKAGTCKPTPVKDGKLCDDDDLCTSGDSCKAGACVSGEPICACTSNADCLKQDTDLCDGTWVCDKSIGKCVFDEGSVVVCDPSKDDLCKTNTCDPASGKCSMVKKTDYTPCEDGDPCTMGDVCIAGWCAQGDDKCECKTDDECAGKQTQPCLGPQMCDKAKAPWTCQDNPAAKVKCPPGKPCEVVSCEPSTGKCVAKPASIGTPCDDGDPCSQGTTCSKGSCIGGKSICTCKSDADCSAKEDGDLCNGTLYCDKSGAGGWSCKVNPGTVVYCAPGTKACTAPVCDAKTGKCAPGPVDEGKACSDGSQCTQGDACKKGVCAGVPLSCDDGKGCTQDICDPKDGSCGHVKLKEGAACDDGDACTTGEVCVANQCGGKPKGCDDANGCTADSCVSSTGCVHKPLTGGCEDGSACTAPDVCVKGACEAGPAKSCDDGKPCTDDSCDLKTGCVHKVSTKPCSDGNACTVGDVCSGGACKPGKGKSCDDGQPCTINGCNKQTGACTKVDKKGACEDGDKCTQGDTCVGGACKSGKKKDCNDNKPCTTNDRCEGGVCKYTPKGQYWYCGPNKWCASAGGSCVAVSVPQGMVWVAAPISFTMGCNGCGGIHAPEHTVQLTKGFYIDRYEVTAGQYAQCVVAGKCVAPDVKGGTSGSTYGVAKKSNHPVNFVGRVKAKKYCEWKGRRLCDEWEWEYAARGWDGRAYPWGNQGPDCNRANYGTCKGTGKTAAVGSYPSGVSPFGAYDMAGNVAEWVGDFHMPYKAGKHVDPASNNPGTQLMSRGGGFWFGTSELRTFIRNPVNKSATVTQANRGFRCCKGVP